MYLWLLKENLFAIDFITLRLFPYRRIIYRFSIKKTAQRTSFKKKEENFKTYFLKNNPS